MGLKRDCEIGPEWPFGRFVSTMGHPAADRSGPRVDDTPQRLSDSYSDTPASELEVRIEMNVHGKRSLELPAALSPNHPDNLGLVAAERLRLVHVAEIGGRLHQ
jgi:hypothetical protein